MPVLCPVNLLEEDSVQGRKIETGFVGDQLGVEQLFNLGCSSTVKSLWRLCGDLYKQHS